MIGSVSDLGHTLLNRTQLEIRAESWIAKRLSPTAHIGLPSHSDDGRSAWIFSRFWPLYSKKREAGISLSHPTIPSDFTGGSGPLFDLQFDAGPALQMLRQLDLVRGSDDEGLESVPFTASVHETPSVSSLSAFLSPESQEDDLGFPRMAIQQ